MSSHHESFSGHDPDHPVDGKGGAAAMGNPFDDYDFAQAKTRRERAKLAKEQGKDDAEKSLMAHMDSGGDFDTSGAAQTSTGKRMIRPNIVTARAKTTGVEAGAAQRKKNFFGFGNKDHTTNTNTTDHHSNYTMSSLSAFAATSSAAATTTTTEPVVYEAAWIDTAPIAVGKKTLAVWPYDDYHLVQKLYYEKLDEAAAAATRRQRTESTTGTTSTSSTPVVVDKASATSVAAAAAARALSAAAAEQSSIPIFSRPADPPDIFTAVHGLSLTVFEPKAEERAIAIVSTWLFDVGLIDELLVNGGMAGYRAMMQLASGTTSAATSDAEQRALGNADDKSVQTSSEGVEVGSHGFPIEGSTKMDKEVAKLRNATKRQLALINARLNDGVAATGSEVQELVHAVVVTKDDIGRLRELSTYVSNASDVETTTQFMLTKYPKLKQAINARRNLARCFRELDFFAHIPSTCDRLRDELHGGEWTAHEWSSLRSVAREHVELEIFLVEAEAGMKKRLMEEEADLKRQNRRGGNTPGGNSTSNTGHFGRNAFQQNGLGNMSSNHGLIDRFLEEHVQNVWELGDEIRLRIMSGISTAFDLAMNNPAGMVALVEAVEVYETANGDYKAIHGEEAGNRNQNLRFTDMRAAALAELYKDFETRGLDVFRELTMQAADVAEEEEAANKQFSAVLRASNELASEIGIVKEQMAPCFPPNWGIAILWTTCVAHVCSTNILQQIGGPDGQKLPDLTVTQLLDLVAWVENFREIIEDAFPDIGSITSKRTYLHQPPKLLQDNSKTIDIELAQDSLAWVNNTLWDVHDLAKDEFLFRTKEQTESWLNNVYEADHNKTQTAEGRLVTSLCEDVYSLAGVQLRTIRERLTRRSEALVQAVGVIFKNLYEKQTLARDNFCTDFETCCAAANDFVRMSDKCEEIVNEIQTECSLSDVARETLEEQAAAVLGLYSGDAVYAAQKTHMYCFEPIEEAIFNELFGKEWEVELTHNELALTLVRTLDDFMEDLETFLDEVMVQKAVEAQITSSINFYIKCMLRKSAAHKDGKKSCFEDNTTAITRMRGDMTVMREYFNGLAETMPTLERVITKEFSLLEALIEIVAIASGVSNSSANDFILVVQKRVRNYGITKYVAGDLYHLVNPHDERSVYELIDGMADEMDAVAPTDELASTAAHGRNSVPGLRTDEMMAKHCAESKRNRPIKAGGLERAEKALKVWQDKPKVETHERAGIWKTLAGGVGKH